MHKPDLQLKDGLIDKAMLTAYLLTGSLKQAENSVLSGIRLWNPNTESEETLFNWVMMEAVASDDSSFTVDIELPVELQNVFTLPLSIRRCFVLRILVGMKVEGCARLLNVTSQFVNLYVCQALIWLEANAYSG
jgi:hypothetical protein